MQRILFRVKVRKKIHLSHFPFDDFSKFLQTRESGYILTPCITESYLDYIAILKQVCQLAAHWNGGAMPNTQHIYP